MKRLVVAGVRRAPGVHSNRRGRAGANGHDDRHEDGAATSVHADAAGAGTGAAADQTEAKVVAAFLAVPKVKDWVGRYPKKSLVTQGTYDATVRRLGREGLVGAGRRDRARAGSTIDRQRHRGLDRAAGRVDDGARRPGRVRRARRSTASASGSRSARVFLLGLADLRRPLSLRNLDLLALLSFSVSLWYFNHGRIFTSVPLVYPPLVYLLGRMIWIGVRDRPPPVRRGRSGPSGCSPRRPSSSCGFRSGSTSRDSNVIDVGYAGVIGAAADRARPVAVRALPGRGRPEAVRPGRPRRARSASGSRRTGAASRRTRTGDTYGPVVVRRLPARATAIFGWSGKWDDAPGLALHLDRVRPALHARARARRAALRRQPAGGDARVRVGGLPVHAVRLELEHERRDHARVPDLGLLARAPSAWAPGRVRRRSRRGRSSARCCVAPLWATYPEPEEPPDGGLIFAAGFALATAAAFWVLLLEPNPLHAARVFWDRTIPSQIDRHSPFSLWDWRQYHAGLPDLHVAPAGAPGAARRRRRSRRAFLPRRKSPLQLAALTGALLIGFELVLTHWFYLYLPWFFAFVAYAVLAAEPQPRAGEGDRPR